MIDHLGEDKVRVTEYRHRVLTRTGWQIFNRNTVRPSSVQGAVLCAVLCKTTK